MSNRGPRYELKETSGSKKGKRTSENESRPETMSSKTSYKAGERPDDKEVRQKQFLQWLSSDVPGIAEGILNDLDNDRGQKIVTKSLAREIDELNRENEGLLQQIQELKLKVSPTNQAEKHRVDQLEKQVAHEQRNRAEAEKKIEEVKITNAELFQLYQDELHQSQKEVEQQKKKILRQEQEIARYKSRNEHYDRIVNELQRTKETLKQKNEELEDYRTSLSKKTDDKLTDENPNVADLSDKNRPTKLAEQYQEIYDNEWTDAYETLDNGNEEKTIASLINILQEARKFCDDEGEKQMTEIQYALTQGSSSVMETSMIHVHVPTGVKKQLKDYRKSLAEHSGKQMYQRYHNTLERSWSQTGKDALKVPKFIEACVKICWLMAVQDPPVVFGPFSQSCVDLDTDVYKAYTKSGKKIMFVVWPALHLHKDGPLMCKGIAQGEGFQRPKSAPPDRGTEKPNSDARPSSTRTFKPVAVSENAHYLAANKSHAFNEKDYHKRSGSYERQYINEESNYPQYESSTSTRGYKSEKEGYVLSEYDDESVTGSYVSSLSGREPGLSSYELDSLGYSSHTKGYTTDTLRYESGARGYDPYTRNYLLSTTGYKGDTRYNESTADFFESGTKDFRTSTSKYSSDARHYDTSRTPNLVTANYDSLPIYSRARPSGASYRQTVATKSRSYKAKNIKRDPPHWRH